MHHGSGDRFQLEKVLYYRAMIFQDLRHEGGSRASALLVGAEILRARLLGCEIQGSVE